MGIRQAKKPMKSITEQLAQLTQIKNNLKLAIRSKGVTVLDTDGLAVYASKIAEISNLTVIHFNKNSTYTWEQAGVTIDMFNAIYNSSDDSNVLFHDDSDDTEYRVSDKTVSDAGSMISIQFNTTTPNLGKWLMISYNRGGYDYRVYSDVGLAGGGDF